MKLTSTAFTEGEIIPKKFTGDGRNVNPPLHIEDIPADTKSLALLVNDRDAPSGEFNHWVLFNIDPHTHDIVEGCPPVISTQGRNGFGNSEYGGPQPPSGEHRYWFKLFALDTMLNLARGCRQGDVESAMSTHVIDEAVLMGRYSRN